MKLGKREKMLAAAFGVFLVLFLMEKFIFSPFLERLEIVDTQIESYEKKLERLLYIDSQGENITKIFGDIKPYIELGKTIEDTLSVVMKKMEEMAKNCNITLLNMKPDMSGEEVEPGRTYKKVKLNIEGSQNNIVKFLYKLENSNYPLSIKKLDFKIKDRKANLMEADLDVHFIYFL